MDSFLVVSLIVFIPINLIFSLVIYLNNPNSWTNRYFSFLIILLTIYLFVNSFINADFLSYEVKLFLARSVIAFGALINAAAFLFLRTFPETKNQASKKVMWLIIASSIALFLMGFSNLIIRDLEISGVTATPVVGPIMPIFMVHTLALIGLGIMTLVIKYRKSRGLQKERVGYVLISFFILFLCIVLFNFILAVVFQFGDMVPFLPVYLLMFNIIVGYAILKRRLLDIKSLVARSVAYTVLIIVVAMIYALLLFLIGRVVPGISFSNEALFFAIAMAVILAISIQPLRMVIAKLTDKALYKDHYDSNKLIYELSRVMASSLHLEDLSRGVLSQIVNTMKIEHGTIFLTEEGKIYQIVTEGKDNTQVVDEKDINEILLNNELLVYDDLKESELKKIMKKYDFAVTSEMVHEGEEMGMIALGDKLSGDTYDRTDLAVLSIFSPQAATAIKNAKAYEEIRRFNITLEEEIEKATSQLVSANKKLQELDKLKDEFVSIASHELRTPMVSIKNYIWMTLAGKGGKLQRKQKFYLDRAYSSAKRMSKLINDLLNISRIESGRIMLSIDKYDIGQLVEQIVDEFKPRAKEFGVTVTIECPIVETKGQSKKTDLPAVIIDRDKVAEVLTNLIGNALKFSPKQSKVKVCLSASSIFVTVKVIDEGVGLDKDQIPKLFKKFGMLKESYSSQGDAAQGTGLGLYISRSIIELHGGEIGVTSAGHGKGSTFFFSVPVYTESKLKKLQKKFDKATDAGIISTSERVEDEVGQIINDDKLAMPQDENQKEEQQETHQRKKEK